MRVREGSFRGPKGIGLLTFRGLLIRERESFDAKFRGAEGTFKVPFGPLPVTLETESAGGLPNRTKTLRIKGQNIKRRELSLSAF